MFKTFDNKLNILFHSMWSMTFYILSFLKKGECRNSLSAVSTVLSFTEYFSASEKGFLKCYTNGILSQVEQRRFAISACSFGDLFQAGNNVCDAESSLTVAVIFLNFSRNLLFPT